MSRNPTLSYVLCSVPPLLNCNTKESMWDLLMKYLCPRDLRRGEMEEKMESQRLDGFKDMRKENSGRSKTKDMTPDEIIERLQHQNHVLRQENDFLKRVRSINRRQLSKMQKNKP